MAHMPRTGRPPIDAEKRLGAAIPVRFTAAERERIEHFAAEDEMSVGAWVRDAANARAKRREQKAAREDQA